MIYKVGLTGGIGSGKTTVAACFAELDAPVFSADAISHELVRGGQAALLEIAHTFGRDILLKNGELDRAALAKIVFSDDASKAKLEAILHPRIRQTMHQRAEASNAPYCILDIPLLLNTAERAMVHRVLVVECNESLRLARIKQRNGWSEQKIRAVMAAQVSDQTLRAAADDLIDNQHAQEDLLPQVAALHQKYLQLAASRSK